MLSAQCTDKRVNLVTRDLFQRCRTAQDYPAISQEELEGLVRSTGFYRNKAKNIRTMGAKLLAEHNGQVPDTLEALAALPGVGRKTANVVLGNTFSKNEGVVVDTRFGRLSQRLGLTKFKDPVRHRAGADETFPARVLDRPEPLADLPRPLPRSRRPSDQRSQRREPRLLRHLQQATRHDRVGVEIPTGFRSGPR
jgi:endonuclease III